MGKKITYGANDRLYQRLWHPLSPLKKGIEAPRPQGIKEGHEVNRLSLDASTPGCLDACF